jgi:UDP-GlcNAc:undecaprenyl-phosphate GlcNAc-1-phosphate transferase
VSPWILPVAGPFVVSAVLIAALRSSRWATWLADHPNSRSLHANPTPRLGGVAIVLAALPIAIVLSGGTLRWTWALASGLAIVSFLDDLKSLPVAVRLTAHFTAAALAIGAYPVVSVDWQIPLMVFGVLGVAWMTNLYNFMDGADGLAGGMTMCGFAAYAVGASMAGDAPLAFGCAAISAAAAGFLLHNFPPARVFMGDAGSIPVGFLAGALGAYGYGNGSWPAWFPLLVFSPFVVDATVTLARRSLRRERIWIAHRSHAYQRLVLTGWTTRRLCMGAYALMIASSASALVARDAEATTQWVILGLWCAFYFVAMAAMDRRDAPGSVP